MKTDSVSIITDSVRTTAARCPPRTPYNPPFRKTTTVVSLFRFVLVLLAPLAPVVAGTTTSGEATATAGVCQLAAVGRTAGAMMATSARSMLATRTAFARWGGRSGLPGGTAGASAFDRGGGGAAFVGGGAFIGAATGSPQCRHRRHTRRRPATSPAFAPMAVSRDDRAGARNVRPTVAAFAAASSPRGMGGGGVGGGGGGEFGSATPLSLGTTATLTSTKSATVKLFRSLLTKRKIRKRHNATVIEGCRVVRDVLADRRTAHLIRHVLVTERFLEGGGAEDECGRGLVDMLMAAPSTGEEEGGESTTPRVSVSVCTEEVMSACTDTVTPQGVAALCSIPPPFDPSQPPPPSLDPHGARDGGDAYDARLYLVLDGISDPGNLGTLLRSSVATGASAVLLLPSTVDPWGPKALRSAAGATFLVPLLEIVGVDGDGNDGGGLDECLEVLGRCGVPGDRFYAATLDTGGDVDGTLLSPAHYDVDWVRSATSSSSSSSVSASGQAAAASALCVGREGPGLSPEVRDAVSQGKIRSVHVPMEARSTESLNAAVCGSVVMFEWHRQRRMMMRERRSLRREPQGDGEDKER